MVHAVESAGVLHHHQHAKPHQLRRQFVIPLFLLCEFIVGGVNLQNRAHPIDTLPLLLGVPDPGLGLLVPSLLGCAPHGVTYEMLPIPTVFVNGFGILRQFNGRGLDASFLGDAYHFNVSL